MLASRLFKSVVRVPTQRCWSLRHVSARFVPAVVARGCSGISAANVAFDIATYADLVCPISKVRWKVIVAANL